MDKRVFQRVKVITNYVKAPAQILDIGCGDGSFGLGLIETDSRYTVTGIDCDYDNKGRINSLKNMMRIKQDELEGKLFFVEKDFTKHKFNQTFDLVTSFAAIDYIQSRDEQKKLINYLKSITNPKGFHFISMHVNSECGNSSYGKLENSDEIKTFYEDWNIVEEPMVRVDPSTGEMVSIIVQKP